MMRLTLAIVVCSLLAILGCDSSLLSLPGPASPTPMPEPRYAGSDDVRLIDITRRPELKAHYASTGAELGFNIEQGLFDRNNDGELDDRAKFIRNFRSRVPTGFRGIIALDWEGTLRKWLTQDPSSPQFKRAVENCLELLAIVRAERPEAQYGFYGMPGRQYWKRDTGWRKRNQALVPLLKKMDWIGPSLYLLYKSPDQRPASETTAYLRENVELALELGEATGKPVFVWVTHRYHPSNKTLPNALIDLPALQSSIDTILSTTHRGKSVSGIIWWAHDSWYHKRGEIPDQIQGNAEAYFSQLHKKYLDGIAARVK